MWYTGQQNQKYIWEDRQIKPNSKGREMNSKFVDSELGVRSDEQVTPYYIIEILIAHLNPPLFLFHGKIIKSSQNFSFFWNYSEQIQFFYQGVPKK